MEMETKYNKTADLSDSEYISRRRFK